MSTPDWIAHHRNLYLRTDGREGHLWDLSGNGFDRYSPILLLRTVGRKSGQPHIVPLLYLPWGDEYVVIASNAGAKDHPDWFLNLADNSDVAFQIGGKRWQARIRTAEGTERQSIWDYATHRFAQYDRYAEAAGDRLIPVVLLKPGTELPSL